MLYTDYKILAKVFARRMSDVLPALVYPGQTGFVPGRYIGLILRILDPFGTF